MQNRQLRETEARLEESLRRYTELYDFAPIVYLTLDVKGRIQEANLTAATFLRTDRGHLTGKPLMSFVAASRRAQLRGHLERLFTQGSALSVELELSCPGLPALFVNATSVPVLDDAGQVAACRTALTDISALKRTEARLVILSSASKLLATSLDVETAILEALARRPPVVRRPGDDRSGPTWRAPPLRDPPRRHGAVRNPRSPGRRVRLRRSVRTARRCGCWNREGRSWCRGATRSRWQARTVSITSRSFRHAARSRCSTSRSLPGERRWAC